MRDLNRLDESYEQIKEIHKRSFPDMREAQFLLNYLGWAYNKHGDPFFYESDKFVEYAKEYANEASMFYQGWPVLNEAAERMKDA